MASKEDSSTEAAKGDKDEEVQIMTDYERERLERIRSNQALLKQIGLTPLVCASTYCTDDQGKKPVKKRIKRANPNFKPRRSTRLLNGVANSAPSRTRNHSSSSDYSHSEGSSDSEVWEASSDEEELSGELELDEVASLPSRPTQKGSLPRKGKSKKRRSKNKGGHKIFEQAGRVYDNINGKTCHQCRQKTMDEKTQNCVNFISAEAGTSVVHQFCKKCLLNRYGEDIHEVQKKNGWLCPFCRGICNCSFCRTKNGKKPTGILIHAAKERGCSSVHELLQRHDVSSKKRRRKSDTDANSQRSKRRKKEHTTAHAGEDKKDKERTERGKREETKTEGKESKEGKKREGKGQLSEKKLKQTSKKLKRAGSSVTRSTETETSSSRSGVGNKYRPILLDDEEEEKEEKEKDMDEQQEARKQKKARTNSRTAKVKISATHEADKEDVEELLEEVHGKGEGEGEEAKKEREEEAFRIFLSSKQPNLARVCVLERKRKSGLEMLLVKELSTGAEVWISEHGVRSYDALVLLYRRNAGPTLRGCSKPNSEKSLPTRSRSSSVNKASKSTTTTPKDILQLADPSLDETSEPKNGSTTSVPSSTTSSSTSVKDLPPLETKKITSPQKSRQAGTASGAGTRTKKTGASHASPSKPTNPGKPSNATPQKTNTATQFAGSAPSSPRKVAPRKIEESGSKRPTEGDNPASNSVPSSPRKGAPKPTASCPALASRATTNPSSGSAPSSPRKGARAPKDMAGTSAAGISGAPEKKLMVKKIQANPRPSTSAPPSPIKSAQRLNTPAPSDPF